MEKKLTNIEFVKKLQEIATNYKTVYGNGMFGQPITENIIVQKLLSNKTISEGGNLKFAASIVHVFPNLKKADIPSTVLKHKRA